MKQTKKSSLLLAILLSPFMSVTNYASDSGMAGAGAPTMLHLSDILASRTKINSLPTSVQDQLRTELAQSYDAGWGNPLSNALRNRPTVENIAWLLKNSGKKFINCPTRGCSALHLAQDQDPKITKLLLAYGADPSSISTLCFYPCDGGREPCRKHIGITPIQICQEKLADARHGAHVLSIRYSIEVLPLLEASLKLLKQARAKQNWEKLLAKTIKNTKPLLKTKPKNKTSSCTIA